MIEPRLTAEIQISAFRKLAEATGGFAAVLRKGDPTSGAILVIGLINGAKPRLFERFSTPGGSYSWQLVADEQTPIQEFWQKRAARDPDIWVIELDVASVERLNDLIGTQY